MASFVSTLVADLIYLFILVRVALVATDTVPSIYALLRDTPIETANTSLACLALDDRLAEFAHFDGCSSMSVVHV